MEEVVNRRKAEIDNFKRDIDKVLDKYLEKICEDTIEVKEKELLYVNYYDSNGKKFIERPSLLTKLMDDSNVRALYNIALSFFVLGIIRVLIINYNEVTEGVSSLFVFENVYFPPINQIVYIWIQMFFLSFAVYPLALFYYDSVKYKKYLLLGSYIAYLIYFFWHSAKSIFELDCKYIATCMLCGEQLRLFMKIYSFFRENIRFKDEKDRTFPNFTLYLYFLFAPTLIYRDKYPRTKTIRWSVVLSELIQIFFCFIFLYIIFVKLARPRYELIFSGGNRIAHIIFLCLENSLMGTFLLLIGFYLLLHAWLNFFAELLNFSDRMFYTDWWNSISYGEYYKTWNIVVYDWLKTYIFNDLKLVSHGKFSSSLGSVVVITVSSSIHEYVVTMAQRSFCPGFIFSFGIFGLILKLFSPSRANIKNGSEKTRNALLWLSFMLGGGVLITFYGGETFAASVCPNLQYNSLLSYLRPRIFNNECSYSKN